MIGRRVRDLIAFGIVIVLTCVSVSSEATLARAVSLAELVQASDWVVVATATKATSSRAVMGTNERVVTDTTLEVTQSLTSNRTNTNFEAANVTVRTLGGTIDDIVYHVYGEAVLRPGTTSLLFLRSAAGGRFHVTGMAQGEYRVVADNSGQQRLRPSLGLDGVLNREKSAVTRLAGLTIQQARALVEESHLPVRSCP